MYVYVITNSVNDKVYVGQTVRDSLDTYLRNDVTRALLDSGDDRKPHLYPAIRKYGPDKFFINPLVSNIKTKEQLDRWEKFFICAFNSNSKDCGYNIAAGGGGSFGYKRPPVSAQTRDKLRKAGIGKKHSEETKLKMSLSAKGKPKSEETKLKLSLAKLGKKLKPFSKEHCERISNSLKGKKYSSERIEKARQGIIDYYANRKAKEMEGVNVGTT